MTTNGQGLPILIAGGGIGGLAAAYALARKGFPVRVLEQAAGIPRDRRRHPARRPISFARSERIGLKDARAGRCLAAAGAGNALRADRRARHPHAARRRHARRASASLTRSPIAPTSTASSSKPARAAT